MTRLETSALSRNRKEPDVRNQVPAGGDRGTVVGLIASYDLFVPRPQRIILDDGLLLYWGPAFLVVGVILFFKHFASKGGRSFYRGVLVLGVLMLAVGGCPWIYTPYLMDDRPGGEGAGMMGTAIFIVVGLPGLVVALIGLVGYSVTTKDNKAVSQEE